MTDSTTTAPTFAERREETLQHLRSAILADAPKAAEAITAAADRLGVVELLQAAAAASDGTGRIAWLCCAVALSSSDSPDEARAELGRMLEDGKLKTTALACLGALCGDDDKAPETP